MTDEQLEEGRVQPYFDGDSPDVFGATFEWTGTPYASTSLAHGDEPTNEWPAEVVAEIRAAEAAHQRSVCFVPEDEYPDDLDRALALRVEVNLAQYDGGEVRRVGGKDPEVRRIEATYSRRRAAGSIDHTQEGQS